MNRQKAMKTILVALAAVCLPLSLAAQEAEGSVSGKAAWLEVGGASTGAGVSYDMRFGKHSHWGWRAGFGWSYTESSDFLGRYSSVRGWSVPIEANVLIGNHHKSLELGLGVNLGVYNGHWQEYSIWQEDITQADYERYLADPSLLPPGAVPYSWGDGQDYYCLSYTGVKGRSRNVFGYYFFGNIGYRHVARSGFLFRVGISPSWQFGGSHAVHKGWFWPYLGFGWAF